MENQTERTWKMNGNWGSGRFRGMIMTSTAKVSPGFDFLGG